MPEPETQVFKLAIVSPDKVVWEGEAKKLIFPGFIQDVAILPDHTPFYGSIKPGDLQVTMSNNVEKKIPVEGGIIRVKQNQVSIVLGFE